MTHVTRLTYQLVVQLWLTVRDRGAEGPRGLQYFYTKAPVPPVLMCMEYSIRSLYGLQDKNKLVPGVATYACGMLSR